MPFTFPYPGLYPDPELAASGAAALVDKQSAAQTASAGQNAIPPTQQVMQLPETEIDDRAEYTEVPDDPGYYGDTAQAAETVENLDDIVWGHPGGRGGVPQAIQPKQVDLDKAGGAENIAEQRVQSELMAGSAERQGQAGEYENDRLSQVYGEESKRQTQTAADWRARQLQDQAFYEKRAMEIDRLGDAIARKRIDEGRWVRNPGNFFAALGAALVGMGSGDSTVGYRLIDQAIQRDLSEQRYEHDQMRADKLGLENNVQLYRQLMGDRQAGDMIHEAKLRQSAAMKVEEIASQLRSKEAKERGTMLAAELRKQAAQMMQITMASAFLPPQARPKALADAQTNFGDVQKFGPNQNAAAPGTAPNRAVGQALGAVAQASPGASQGASGGGQAPVVSGAPSARPSGPAGVGRAASSDVITVGTTYDQSNPEGRRSVDYSKAGRRMGDALENIDGRIGVPGAGNLILRARQREQAMAAAHAPNNPNEQKLFLDKRRQAAHTRVAELAKGAKDVEDRASKWSELLRANEELKRKFKNSRGETDYAAIDKWLGQSWKYVAGKGTHGMVQRLKEVATSSNTTLSDEQRRAAVEYASKLQSVINAYGHEVSGGAITNTGPEGGEFGRLKTVLSSDAPAHQIFSMSDYFSRQYGDQFMQRLTGAPLEDKLIYIADKGMRLSGIPTEGR